MKCKVRGGYEVVIDNKLRKGGEIVDVPDDYGRMWLLEPYKEPVSEAIISEVPEKAPEQELEKEAEVLTTDIASPIADRAIRKPIIRRSRK